MKFVYLITALTIYLMSYSIEANAADKALRHAKSE